MAGHEQLLEGLDPAQVDAVTSEAAPLCVLAGAGSGKTRVLTRRIAWRSAVGTASANHVLALTFTRKAAAELRARLTQLGIRDRVAAGTFHGLAYAQLRRRWADAGGRAPTILDRKAGLLAGLVTRRAGQGPAPLAELAGEIEWAKARMVGPGAYENAAAEANRRPPLPPSEVAALYERYEYAKRQRGAVDFDDLLLECATGIEHDPEFAAGQRWRFRHIFVDEFQDVNPSQARLLRGWLGDRQDLCVVGDPDQAIYSWNGADPSQLHDLPRTFPGLTVINLDDNYRSTPQVLAVAGAVLGTTRRGRAGGSLRANCADGPLPSVTAYPSDVAEARGVARRLREAREPGASWSGMAVLTRTNAQLVLLEEALRGASIPYRVRGGSAFLDQPLVREALRRLEAGPPDGSLQAWLTDLVASPGGDGVAEDEDPRMQLDNLVRLGREYMALGPDSSARGFLDWMSLSLRGESTEPGGEGVTLCTFHRAKGLEWRTVFLAGLERGLVPLAHAASPAERAEERRLVYVAITRAESHLHCSWAARRTFGARTVQRSPSPYLEPIEGARQALAEGRRPADVRRLLSVGRAALERAERQGRNARRRPAESLAEAADPSVLDALKVWRSEMARASGVPAYVIFHDSTLAAVAAARPVSRDELLALPGLGPVKAARYGTDLLSLVAGKPA